MNLLEILGWMALGGVMTVSGIIIAAMLWDRLDSYRTIKRARANQKALDAEILRGEQAFQRELETLERRYREEDARLIDTTMRTYEEQVFFAGHPAYFWHTKERCDRTRTNAAMDLTPLPGCVIHSPSDHKMREWPMYMQANTLIVRLCPHGIYHPDPDSAAALNYLYQLRGPHTDFFAHPGCDNCCAHNPAASLETVW